MLYCLTCTIIHQNVQKGIGIKHPETETYMEYDIWIPDHQLSFEFQVRSYFKKV